MYIASPYTIGDPAVNVKAQIDVADELISLGFVPFVPLYFHFQHMIHHRPYSDWIDLGLEWVSSCDCLLRLPGNSNGADGEVKYAKLLEKPVFYSVKELTEFYNLTRELG